MKIKQLLIKTLFVAVGLCAGASAAWAAGEIEFKAGNTIGATDNSTAWYGQASEIIAVGPHQRLTLKFKTYTATDDQLTAAGVEGAWHDQLTHALNIWDGQKQNFYMKGNSWGWKAHGGEINDPADYDVNASGVFNSKTYGWGSDYRTMIGTGADVVMYIERNGSEMSISQTFTTSGGDKYYHYFSGTFGLANGDVWLQMTVERAHIDITADKELTDASITGTLIGKQNNTGGFKGGDNIDFTIGANKTLELNFKSFTNKINPYNGWGIEMQYGGDYFDFTPGNKNMWGGLNESPTTDWGTWPSAENDRKEAMDGATVKLTIARSGGTVTVTAVHVTAANDTHTITHSFTPTAADFATSDVTFRFGVEGGHLDLLPVTKTITAAGWATYCSPCALNLADASATLEDAYIVTGGNDGVLTLTSVKNGTVPANTGLLLKGSEGTEVTVTIPIVGSSTTDVSANKLKGVTEPSELAANGGYVLMGTPKVGFYQNSNAFTVGANTAYLPANFAAAARSFYSFGDATAIKAIGNSSTSEAAKPSARFAIDNYYNVAGQRVAAPTKGLYIKNGKKIVVK